MARTGRRPGISDTRARIAAAARAIFAERGIEGASIRAIGRAAGVDPALVHHQFGSKEALFLQVMDLPVDLAGGVGTLLAGGEEGIGERLATFVLAAWDRPEVRPIMLGVIRSAVTDPQAAALLRELVIARALRPLAAGLGRPDAELRAVLAGSQMVGLLMARFVVGIEPLASLDRDTLASAVGPTLQRYLTEDLAGVRARGG